MYLPSHFEENRPESLHRLICAHPLGLLVTLAGSDGEHAHAGRGGDAFAGELRADSIPFLHEVDPLGGPGVLRCHVARANPVWRDTHAGSAALVVFQGPQVYISPSLYPTKVDTGRVVPTWNYCVVQARGPLRVIEDAAWLHALVTRLTDRHEAVRAAPWAVSDAPGAYIDGLLRAIVGIEIELTSLRGKWKVSQNRPAVDRDGVAAGLRREADAFAHHAAASRHAGDAESADDTRSDFRDAECADPADAAAAANAAAMAALVDGRGG